MLVLLGWLLFSDIILPDVIIIHMYVGQPLVWRILCGPVADSIQSSAITFGVFLRSHARPHRTNFRLVCRDDVPHLESCASCMTLSACKNGLIDLFYPALQWLSSYLPSTLRVMEAKTLPAFGLAHPTCPETGVRCSGTSDA